MLFKGFHISNYKQYGDDFFVDLSNGFSGKGKNVMLIGAENGTGKTSFIKAIKYLLYGFKDSKGRNMMGQDIADLINNTSKTKGFWFQLDYISDMGEELSLKRSRDIIKGQELLILKDGKPLSTPEDEIVSYINNSLIPEGISKFFFFTGEDVKIFTEEEQKKGLRNPIEVVLGINKYSNLIDNLKKIKRNYSNRFSLGSVSDQGLKNLEKELQDLEIERDTKVSNSESLDSDIKELNKQADELQSKMDTLFNGELLDRKAEIDEKLRINKISQERLKDKISEWKGEIPMLLLKGYCDIITNEIKYSEEVNKASAFQSEIDRTIDALYKPEELISHTKWNDKYYDIIYKKLSELHGETVVEKKDFVLDISYAQKSEINSVISSLKRSFSISGNELSDLLTKYESLGREIEKLEKEREKLSNNTSWKNEWDLLNNNLKIINGKIGAKKAMMVRYMGSDTYKLNDEIKKKQNEISEYKEKMGIQSSANDKLARIDKYIELLESYIEILRNDKIDLTEKTIEEKYKDICHEDIKKVTIDRNSYEISIHDSHNNIKQTQELGDAEKTLFALSIIWGLGKISELDIPLVMDAPIAPLDKNHKTNFLTKYLPKAGRQVILFSNSEHIEPKEDYEKIKPYLYNEKTFTKKSGFMEKTSVIITDGYFKN